jgi:DNA polymerase III epsilon subunit-like protein
MSIAARAIRDTPIAVVDTETTGLYPGGDRVIEIAVVRADPGEEPKLVVDTLVNPRRPVAATEIHGITDEDVADAPPFEAVAADVVQAMRGAVFASYNVYFDARFVREELRRSGVARFPPHLCLMYLRPMLGLGRKCSLGDACGAVGIHRSDAHHASADALAAAALWRRYLDTCERDGIRTFADLGRLKSYKFVSSFGDALMDECPPRPAVPVTMKSRRSAIPMAVPAVRERQPVVSDYWDALMAALSDLDVTPHEIFYLKAKQQALRIRPDELRWMHARAFTAVLADMCQDKAVTSGEADTLSAIALALRELGWAPGDPAAGLAAGV